MVTIYRILLCFPPGEGYIFPEIIPPGGNTEYPGRSFRLLRNAPGAHLGVARKILISQQHARTRPYPRGGQDLRSSVQREEVWRGGYKAQHGESLSAGGAGSLFTKKRVVSNPSQVPAVRTDNGRSGKGGGSFFSSTNNSPRGPSATSWFEAEKVGGATKPKPRGGTEQRCVAQVGKAVGILYLYLASGARQSLG